MYYDQNGEPIGPMEWATVYEDRAACVVQQTDVGDYWISTVWLGLDHSFMGGPPLIFETMIKHDDEWTEYQERYSTRAEAEEGHRRAVALVKTGGVS